MKNLTDEEIENHKIAIRNSVKLLSIEKAIKAHRVCIDSGCDKVYHTKMILVLNSFASELES